MCGETNFRAVVGALWLQAAIWGFYVPLYCASTYVFTRLRRHRIFYVTTTLNFLLCTAMLLLSFASISYNLYNTCYNECVHLACRACGEETEEVLHDANVHNLINIIGTALGLANEFICDSVIIWRCFALWNRSYWIVALPIILLTGKIGIFSYEIYSYVEIYLIRLRAPLSETNPPSGWERYNSLNATLIPINDIISLSLNVLITSLIVGRILYVVNDINGLAKIRRKQARQYQSITSIFIESGALVAVAYVLQLSGSYTNYTFATMASAFLQQIMGVTPTLLILHLAFISNTKSDFDFSSVVAALSFQSTAPCPHKIH